LLQQLEGQKCSVVASIYFSDKDKIERKIWKGALTFKGKGVVIKRDTN
jgi:hypothetical protein